MKRKLLLWLLPIVGLPIFGQTNKEQYDSVYYYSWGGCWNVSKTERYNYLDNTCIVDFETYNQSTGEITKTQTKYTYDSENKLIELETQNRPVSSFDDKNVYTYAANDSLIRKDEYRITSADWVLTYFDSITYNTNGLKKEKYWIGLIGDVRVKITCTSWKYDTQGRITDITESTYTGENKEDNSKIFYVYENGLLSEMFNYTFFYTPAKDSNAVSKAKYIYSNSVLVKKENLTWDYMLMDWQNDNYDEYYYSLTGNISNIYNSKYFLPLNAVAYTTLTSKNYNENNTVFETNEYSWRYHAWAEKSRTIKYFHNAGIQSTDPEFCYSNKHNIALESSCASSIQEVKNGQVLVYPNPSDGNLIIRLTEHMLGNCSVKIISLDGKVIYQNSFYSNSANTEQSIQINGISTGIYYLFIASNNKIYQNKLLIDVR